MFRRIDLAAWVECGLVIAGLVATPAAAAPDPATLRRMVDAAIQPLMARRELPGMAVAVTVAGQAHFFNYGEASRETHQPVSEDTLFEIGSVSKAFTATLAGYAQARGNLSMAEHPSRYFPELKGRAIDRATLLSLGTYTGGGLPLQFPDAVIDHESMVRFFQNWKPTSRPGAQRRYSNPSAGLFGYLVGLSLKRDFADAVEGDLLPRLGLTHTYLRVPPSAMALYAWGYDKEDRPVRVNPGVFDSQAYGVKSTSADMIRFVHLNLDPGGLEEPMRRAIEATQVGHFRVGAAMVQGLGWEQYAYPVSLEGLLRGNSDEVIFAAQATTRVTSRSSAPRLFDKTGSTGGFGAYVAFVPRARIGIVMLANRNYPIADRVRAAAAILDGLDPRTK